MEITDSILDSTKKRLGLDPEETPDFDQDLIDIINGALSSLTQIGIGPKAGFEITGNEETWTSFVGEDPRFNLVKSYVYFRTKLAFDPPATSFALSSLEDQLREYEWRLNFYVETPATFKITE